MGAPPAEPNQQNNSWQYERCPVRPLTQANHKLILPRRQVAQRTMLPPQNALHTTGMQYYCYSNNASDS